MLRARSQLDGALAVVAFFHQQITDALAATIRALPFVSFDIAIVFVAHFFLRPEIAIVHAAFQGNNLPLMTLVTLTLPVGSATVMFWLTGRPLWVLYWVFVVTDLPSVVLKWLISPTNLPLLS
jgi:hypothetical protein